jgi:hypothetical protein
MIVRDLAKMNSMVCFTLTKRPSHAESQKLSPDIA